MTSHFIHRPIIMSVNGLVTSGHYLASLAGLDVLKKGGTAFDSAIATSAVLSVVMPHQTGLGGDAFMLLYDARRGEVKALNGSGPAPLAASTDFFLEKNLQQIPSEGIFSTSVPGIVACWFKILEEYGTLSLKQILKPAIGYAIRGFPVYNSLSTAIKDESTKLLKDRNAKSIYLRKDHPLQPGELLIQKDLGRTLDAICTGGGEAFYQGSIAKLITDHFTEEGGLLREDDLAEYHSNWKHPINTEYRGYRVYEQPPVSQGHILLQELNLLEGFNLTKLGHNTADSIHLMVEAKKIAFADRLEYLGDPEFIEIPLDTLLSKKYAQTRCKLINKKQSVSHPVSHGDVDSRGHETTCFCIVDSQGNAISFIQSIFHSFGSGVIVKGTGILMNNRMCGFSLNDSSPNRLEAGKKTAHTLNTYLIFDGEKLLMLGGSPGADDQVQVNLQVIVNVLDYKMNVQEAIEAPRWSSRPGTVPGEENTPYELWIENRIPDKTCNELIKKGHTLKIVDGWSFGGAQAIIINPRNDVLNGGADPRRDGYAIGY